MTTRWDGDHRGRGIGDAIQLVPGAGELVAAFTDPTWVAEAPELHLLPHVQAWCERGQTLRLIDAYADDAGAYVLDCEWSGAPGRVGEARSAVFSLIGTFAESATYVRQRRVGTSGDGGPTNLQFEVGTGEIGPDTRFVPHGHVVVINVAGVL